MNSDFLLAVHGLVYLNHKKEILSSDVLAQNICTHPARVRRVMAKLKKAGLVETKEGRVDGGYFFSMEPQNVNLKMISNALDVDFVTTGWHSGDPHMECKVASGMAGIMDQLYGQMDEQCKAFLETITIDTIDCQIFRPQEAPVSSKAADSDNTSGSQPSNKKRLEEYLL